jgi:uncharacterized protein (DUF488 family)
VDGFILVLETHRVTAVADVRSAPYSRFNPGFNREGLKRELKKHGISYVFLGRELGGRPTDPASYEDGRASYSRMAQSEPFKEGLERVISGSAKHRIALMCSEGDPLNCHRMLLVARALTERGVSVLHIDRRGELEAQADAETRLVQTCGLGDSLLRNREELVAEAYAVQSKRVAYAERDGSRTDAEAV